MEKLRDVPFSYFDNYSEENAIGMCHYFEVGCRCIRSGKLVVLMDKTPKELYYHYLQGCTCSRHPDGELK